MAKGRTKMSPNSEERREVCDSLADGDVGLKNESRSGWVKSYSKLDVACSWALISLNRRANCRSTLNMAMQS